MIGNTEKGRPICSDVLTAVTSIAGYSVRANPDAPQIWAVGTNVSKLDGIY